MRKLLLILALPLALVLTGCGSDKSTEEAKTPAPAVKKIDPNTPYQASEVGNHATAEDCWSLINSKIYNLTDWIGQHPGGSSPIQAICGRDGSAMFNMQHNVMQGPASMLQEFQIGVVSTTPTTEETPVEDNPVE